LYFPEAQWPYWAALRDLYTISVNLSHCRRYSLHRETTDMGLHHVLYLFTSHF